MLPISAQPDPSQTSATSGTAGNSAGASLSGATDQLTKEDTFLKLLVAQIKNQDPLNPADSLQFVGQLTQFSQLEQLLSINQGVQHLVNSSSSTSGTPPANGAVSQ